MENTEADLCQQTYIFFFFNDTATTEIYTLSLHDALPIYVAVAAVAGGRVLGVVRGRTRVSSGRRQDRKSTRLNSSHSQISYAVFCLKKKNTSRRDPDNVPTTIIQLDPCHTNAHNLDHDST